jgi:hypothetical protein
MSYPQQPPMQPQGQPYMPQGQQYGQQGPPMGTLHLTVQGTALTSNMIPPTVHLNGYPVQVKYGLNAIPVPAGPLHIDVHSQWMRQYGQASLDCTVQPNQMVPVFYASPYHQFTTGSIGHTKVKRKGIGALFGLIGFIFAVIALVIILAAVA